jgi:hypothetical protein
MSKKVKRFVAGLAILSGDPAFNTACSDYRLLK